MKLRLLSLVTVLLTTFSGLALADSVVIEQTKDWTGVPIVVDTTKQTYVVQDGVTVPTTNYYYTYSGYRCFAQKRDFVGVDGVIFHAGVSGGTDIYCYSE